MTIAIDTKCCGLMKPKVRFQISWLTIVFVSMYTENLFASELPSHTQQTVAVLASTAWDFLVATMVLAIVTAVILEAIRDFGFRTLVNTLVVRRWAELGNLYMYGVTRTMLSLSPDELCGQLSALLHPRSEFFRNVYDKYMSEEDHYLEDEGVAVVEKAVDQLQLLLRSANGWLSLVLSIAVAFSLVFSLLAGLRLEADAYPILLTVAGSAALVAPMVRDIIRNTLGRL